MRRGGTSNPSCFAAALQALTPVIFSYPSLHVAPVPVLKAGVVVMEITVVVTVVVVRVDVLDVVRGAVILGPLVAGPLLVYSGGRVFFAVVVGGGVGGGVAILPGLGVGGRVPPLMQSMKAAGQDVVPTTYNWHTTTVLVIFRIQAPVPVVHCMHLLFTVVGTFDLLVVVPAAQSANVVVEVGKVVRSVVIGPGGDGDGEGEGGVGGGLVDGGGVGGGPWSRQWKFAPDPFTPLTSHPDTISVT